MSQHNAVCGQQNVSENVIPTSDQEKTVAASSQNNRIQTEEAGRDTDPLGGENPEPEDLQEGVKQAEAITSAWSRRSLALAYAGYVSFTRGSFI
jgi:hypothetical protein